MKINWSEFLSWEYWFEGFHGDGAEMVAPVILKGSDFFWFFLYFFSAFLVLSIVLKVVQAFLHKEHPFQRKIPFWSGNLAIMGFLGLSWFLFREIKLSFFGGRFWLVVGAAYFLVFLYMAVRYFVIFYPMEKTYYQNLKAVDNKNK